MTAARRRRWPRAVLVALMPCALAVVVWLSLGRGGDAGPPVGDRDDRGAGAVAEVVEPRAQGAIERAEVVDEASPVARSGTIAGVLLDSGGVPVARQRVFCARAEAADELERPTHLFGGRGPVDESTLVFGAEGPVDKSARTDEQGRFSFAELPAGAFDVFAVSRDDIRVEVVLEAGGHRDVTLQASSDLVHVRVEFTHGRAPVKAAFLEFRNGGAYRRRIYLRGGVATNLLPPGRYDIKLFPHEGAEPARLTADSIVVPAGVPRQPFYVAVVGADVAVGLEPADDMEIGEWEVVASACIDDEDVTITREVDGDKRPVFRFLPPGGWTVRVTGPGMLESPPQQLRVLSTDTEHRLTFPVRPGAIVHLSVRDEHGNRLRVPPEFLPELVAEGSSFTCGGDVKAPRFPGVPAGDVALRCVDVVQGDEVRFLPFDEMPDVRANAALDEANVVQLAVRRRARVDLRVCERGGRECFGARITVYAGDRRVRSFPVEQPQRFEAFLPPGDYRVVADRDGALREYTITVGRGTLRLRLRP